MCASDCPMREYGTGGGGRGARTTLHGKPPTAFVGAAGNEDGPGYERAAGSVHPRRTMQPLPDEAKARQKSRVGEQQPVCLEVEEPQDKGSAENCPFSGTIVELQSAQIRATGVEKLLCPACGAARKATIRGELVIYSPHTSLRIARANKGPLWIRQGTIW